MNDEGSNKMVSAVTFEIEICTDTVCYVSMCGGCACDPGLEKPRFLEKVFVFLVFIKILGF